jgi:hypothetical protein
MAEQATAATANTVWFFVFISPSQLLKTASPSAA